MTQAMLDLALQFVRRFSSTAQHGTDRIFKVHHSCTTIAPHCPSFLLPSFDLLHMVNHAPAVPKLNISSCCGRWRQRLGSQVRQYEHLSAVALQRDRGPALEQGRQRQCHGHDGRRGGHHMCRRLQPVSKHNNLPADGQVFDCCLHPKSVCCDRGGTLGQGCCRKHHGREHGRGVRDL